MSKDNYLLKEYDSIHEEIKDKMNLHNSLLTFTITTTVAILTLALTQNKPILYLIPFCVIIPMSNRICYYRFATAKLAAYMVVFVEKNLDGINWETRNAELMAQNIENKKNKKKSFAILHYNECFVLSAVSYALFAVSYMKGKSLDCLVIAHLLIPALLVVWERFITMRIDNIDNDRIEWIQRWEDFENQQQQTKREPVKW